MSPIVLDCPFRGQWRAMNSPARRVPSHGTELFGTKFAIDFVPVDERGRSASYGLRSLFVPEPPEAFVGFGRPSLAPISGAVVAAWDTAPDHAAYRGFPSIGYALTQAQRARAGWRALAGNSVVIAIAPQGPFVSLVHLKQGSVRVQAGDFVEVGQQLGECGNSGNSTEPHLHLQVNDSTDWARAGAIPMQFRLSRGVSLPREGELISC